MGLTRLLPVRAETRAAHHGSRVTLGGTWTPTPALIQLVEQLQQLRVHAVDGLEEGEHSRVVGDAAAPHVVALHTVDKGGDGILEGLQELLVALL